MSFFWKRKQQEVAAPEFAEFMAIVRRYQDSGQLQILTEDDYHALYGELPPLPVKRKTWLLNAWHYLARLGYTIAGKPAPD